MRQRVRHRTRTALVVLLCLLFQQLALAAYACPTGRMPAETTDMVEDCAEMGMQQARDNPVLCAKHCAPDLSIAAEHVVPQVPALALPPPAFGIILTGPVSPVAEAAHVPLDRSDPPPRLRFCSLLI